MATTIKKMALGAAAVALLVASGVTVHVLQEDALERPGDVPREESSAPPPAVVEAARRARRHAASKSRNDTPAAGTVPSDESAGWHEIAVAVVREDLGSTADAWIVLYGNEAVSKARAGEDGTATLRLRELPRGVIATVPGMPPVHERIGAAENPVVLLVPAGHSVEGVVRVNGGEPREPVLLVLHSAHIQAAIAGVPEALRQQVFDAGVSAWNTLTETDSTGRFRFTGFAQPEEAVMLEFGPRWAIEETGDSYTEIDIPARDLVLDLAYRGYLRGRVLVPEGDRPASDARISAVLVSTDPERTGGASSWSMVRDGEEDGTFGAGLPPWERFTLRLSIRAEEGFYEAEIESPPDGSDMDLGDLRLRPFHVARVRAVDAHGGAIETPVTWELQGESVSRTMTTDGGATLRLALSRLRGTVRAGALGYRVTEAEIRADGEVHTVALEHAAVLDIAVTGAPEGSFVRLDAGGPLFAGPAILDAAHYVADTDGTWGGSDTTHWYATKATEPLRIASVVSGRDVEVVLHDRMGTILAREVVLLEPTDHRRIELRATGETHTLRGVVRDADGGPLAGADVAVSDAHGGLGGDVMDQLVVARATSRADGTFAIPDVRTDSVEIAVHAPAHAPWFARSVASAPDGPLLEVRLERSREVALEIVDRDGRPVRSATLAIESPLRPRHAWHDFLWEAYDDDGYRLVDAPREAFTVLVSQVSSVVTIEVPRGVTTHRVVLD